jgi:hypothetical protein
MPFAKATACFEEFAGWAQAIGAHYELLPCDRELQILSTIPQVVEPSTVSLRGVSTNWCANLYILFCLVERLTWTENAGPEERGVRLLESQDRVQTLL